MWASCRGAPKHNITHLQFPSPHIIIATIRLMTHVTIPLPVCLKLLKSPRLYIIKILIEALQEALGLNADDDDMEDQDEDSEGHLDPPETD